MCDNIAKSVSSQTNLFAVNPSDQDKYKSPATGFVLPGIDKGRLSTSLEILLWTALGKDTTNPKREWKLIVNTIFSFLLSADAEYRLSEREWPPHAQKVTLCFILFKDRHLCPQETWRDAERVKSAGKIMGRVCYRKLFH